MILYISFLCLIFLAADYIGYRQFLQLEQLNKARVANGVLIAVCLLTILSFAHLSGLFPQSLAGKITMSLYIFAGGFFIGYGIKLISMRKNAGDIEYMYRSFWTDVAPNIIAVALFVFGIYRTGLLEWEYFTGIGITSGISLIGFGFWGWTVPVVPEFRTNAVLVLDKMIGWEKVVAYRWESESTLLLEYLNDEEQISDFKTYIPPEDELVIEQILTEKIKEFEEERRKQMLNEGQE